MVLVQRRPFFQLLFLGTIGHQNVLYDVVERENAFLGRGFGPKMAIFSTFFCRQYGPVKCVLRYSRSKERLSKL